MALKQQCHLASEKEAKRRFYDTFPFRLMAKKGIKNEDY
jgi:hypothetical protein